MSQKSFQFSIIVLLFLIALSGVFVAFKPTNNAWDTKPKTSETRGQTIVPFGDDGQLATLSLRVNGFEVVNTINGALFGTTYSKDTTVFILVDVSIINTTNSTFTLYPNGILLSDRNGVSYDIFQTTSSGAIGAEKRAIDGRDLGRGIEEKGVIVYEVPKDFIPYALEIEKAETKDTLVFELN